MDVRAQADEWVRLRCSDVPEDYHAAAWADLPLDVWRDVLNRYPEMAQWVAHAKKSPGK